MRRNRRVKPRVINRRASLLAAATLLITAAGLSTALPAAAAETPGKQSATYGAWLCRPGIALDPCETPLDTTVVSPDGSRRISTPPRVGQYQRPVDCFYVYPTISAQRGTNATTARDPEVVAQAEFQASRFSSVCRTYAPLYRQVTVASIALNTVAGPAMDTAYADVLAAWNSYLAHDNHGRGVILIGHSQGSLLLRQLIRTQIDPNPKLRERLVGAFLLGGQVTTKAGSTTGGDFKHVPICTGRGQAGCVVAYSSFASDPVQGAFYGNSATDQLSGAFGEPHGPGYQVACTDPGKLSGTGGPFALTVPTAPLPPSPIAGLVMTNTGPIAAASTTWVSQGAYTGGCRTINGYHVLRYGPVGAGPATKSFPPELGTHLLDFNLGTDRLITIAALQTLRWTAGHPGVGLHRAAVVDFVPASQGNAW